MSTQQQQIEAIGSLVLTTPSSAGRLGVFLSVAFHAASSRLAVSAVCGFHCKRTRKALRPGVPPIPCAHVSPILVVRAHIDMCSTFVFWRIASGFTLRYLRG